MNSAMHAYTIIVVLKKYRLNLSKVRKSPNVRILVVAPPRMLVDETNVDVYYQVDTPMAMDLQSSQLMYKVRELCSVYASTSIRRIVCFEKALQRPVAEIRKDLDIEESELQGLLPDQLNMLISIRDSVNIPRRNGLATLKQCSLSGTPQPEQWAEAVRNQVGGFPAVVRPIKPHCTHSIGVCRNEQEFKAWFRRNSTIHRPEEYIVQQYIDDGHEFTAICYTNTQNNFKNELIGCIANVDAHCLIVEAIQALKPYSFELLTADQTRDVFPGLESFASQVMKSVFQGSYLGIIFIKGYYRNHNDIFFLGFSLEPESETFRHLLALPKYSVGWEAWTIETLAECELEEIPRPSPFHACLNFPSVEGMLLHQTSLQKRQTSELRMAWRTAENQELEDSDGVDDNVLQIFVSNINRGRLLSECYDLQLYTNVQIDKTLIQERQARAKACKENHARHQQMLIRSCTTTD